MSTLYVRFGGEKTLFFAKPPEDFVNLEKEINSFIIPQDYSTPEKVMPNHERHRRGLWKEQCNINEIEAGTTTNYYHINAGGRDIDRLVVIIPNETLVCATGLIDPFWTLFVKRIKFEFFSGAAEMQLTDLTFNDIVKDPIAAAKRTGNRIVIATDRNGRAIIKTVYDGSKEFEEYLIMEAEILKSSYIRYKRRKKKESQIQPLIHMGSIRDTPIEKSCGLSRGELNYWELVDSISVKERAYYGWERDPQ